MSRISEMFDNIVATAEITRTKFDLAYRDGGSDPEIVEGKFAVPDKGACCLMDMWLVGKSALPNYKGVMRYELFEKGALNGIPNFVVTHAFDYGFRHSHAAFNHFLDEIIQSAQSNPDYPHDYSLQELRELARLAYDFADAHGG